MKKIHTFVCSLFLPFMLTGCLGTPDGVEPVSDFNADAYLGTWYEIARLDHSFERGLSRVTAEYSRREDGGIRVVNRGFSEQKNEWKSAEGRAYFVGDDSIAHLKVSFFGPFFSTYAVFGLDHEQYQYAFVSGFNRSYLWLLARTPTVNEKLIRRFEERAEELGFDADQLIYVSQQPTPATQ